MENKPINDDYYFYCIPCNLVHKTTKTKRLQMIKSGEELIFICNNCKQKTNG